MGRVVGAFGVQGWIKVKPYTERPDGLAEHASWVVHTADGWREMAVEGFELHAKGPVARLAGCADRGAAEQLRGAQIAVPRAALAEAEEGTLYQVDLLGYEVRREDGSALGTVDGFFETAGASVMVVKGDRERMIPFVAGYVKEVDREARRITVDWKADYDA
ncbi:MAG TPA: ribosome maturation factor RimM [Usitatibacter sp.]|nr:ribosome maturation factor RimM [Usitatibacter sp.]